MKQYDAHTAKRAMEFLVALQYLCEDHGFALSCHSEMFIEELDGGEAGSMDGLFAVGYRNGYVVEEPIR